MCDTYTERQTSAMAEELDRLQRRDERILLGIAITTWVAAGGCYAGVVFEAIGGNGPLTTGFAAFGTLIGGWGVKSYRTFKSRRARRRARSQNRSRS